MNFSKLINIFIIALVIALGVFLYYFLQSKEETISPDTSFPYENLTHKILVSCRQDNNWGIYAYDFDQNKTVKIIDGVHNEFAPLISSKQNSFYYVQVEDNYNRIVKYSISDNDTDNLVFTKNKIYAFEVAPNEKKLLYTELEANQQSLFIYDSQDDSIEKIAEQVVDFTWFPDGDKFAYIRDKNLYVASIGRISEQIDSEIEIASGLNNIVAVPGTKDSFLSVSEIDGQFNLVMINTTNKEISQFSQLELPISEGDRFKMSYATDQSGIILSRIEQIQFLRGTVWLLNRAGRSVQAILNDVSTPIWSDSAEEIYYVKMDASGLSNIWSYNLDTKQEIKLTDMDSCNSPAGQNQRKSMILKY